MIWKWVTIMNIVQKRTDLINFFLNEHKEYTQHDILNKEFAVLSFSPRDEYIDTIHTPYDNLCLDLSTFEVYDTPECYVKGIIVDVDHQRYQTIFHIQNKDNNIGITVDGATLDKYNNYLVVGDPIIAKCKIYDSRFYLSFLVSINNINQFINEQKYMRGESFSIIRGRKKDDKVKYGVIVECAKRLTKNQKDMLIGTLYDGKSKRSFASVKTDFNMNVPFNAVAGDYIEYKDNGHPFFINDVRIVKL